MFAPWINMDILTHPLFIIFVVLAFIISNIMLLKYTPNMRWGNKYTKKPKSDLDNFDEITQKQVHNSPTQEEKENKD